MGLRVSFPNFQRLFTDNFTVRIRCFDVSFYFTATHCPILLEPSRRIKSSSVRCFRSRCTVAGDFPIASESPFIESFIRSFMGSFDAINLNMRKGCSFVERPLTVPNVLDASVSAYFSLNHTSITGESFTSSVSAQTNPPSSSV